MLSRKHTACCWILEFAGVMGYWSIVKMISNLESSPQFSNTPTLRKYLDLKGPDKISLVIFHMTDRKNY
jgi:hypothetical protein